MNALIASLVSLLAVAVLAWADPKRRRSAGLAALAQVGPGRRRLLIATALLPGLLLALSGDWAAVLIWQGAAAALAWLLVLALALRPVAAPRSRRRRS